METREHLTVRTSWFVPLLRAATAGVLLSIASWSLGNLFNWDRNLPIAGAVGALTAALAWQVEGAAWRRRIDTLAGVPTEPAEPASPSSTLLEMSIDAGRTLKYADLPASLEQLITLAAGVLDGATLSEATWTPGTFTRSEFAKLKAAMIRRGLAEYRSLRDPARGVQLTRAGASAFRWLAGLSDDDPPAPPRLVTRK